MSQNEKFLIIRFSSFGDVVQTLSVPGAIVQHYPNAQVHWITRSDMAPLLANHPYIHRVFAYNKKTGLGGLISMCLEMRKEGYTHIYDAHNNLRSRLICWILRPAGLLGIGPHFIRRSIRRWKRFLLFKFRINTFEQPFSGQRDLLEPLAPWGIAKIAPPVPQLFLDQEIKQKAAVMLAEKNYTNAIALAPSAAYFLKRWPKQYWIDLIENLPNEKFILLGGPEDHFIADIAAIAPERCLNLAGKCSLTLSSAVIAQSKMLIANDTGLLHVAEQLGKDCIALMGPAPFGFPSRPATKIMELNLACRPCSKHGQGPCINKIHHQCLTDIKPLMVKSEAIRMGANS